MDSGNSDKCVPLKINPAGAPDYINITRLFTRICHFKARHEIR